MTTRIWTFVLAIGLTIAAVTLAACGGNVGGKNEGVTTAESGTAEGELVISNWPGYIDLGAGNEEDGEGGTIAEFEDETGVDVSYDDDVNDNASFFSKVQPSLQEGDSGGRDMYVVTDWMANQMHELGYLQEINPDDIPTVLENLAPQFKTSAFDPDREFSIPWQGGMTGIWVNTAEAPEIESVNDLFDPKYKGRVTMLTEMRDTVPLIMKAEGIDPEEATKEQWLETIDKVREAAESGQIRRFTGNEYTEDITSGNAVASIGWSGDASLIDNPDAEWRMPAEGCILWFDNMVIPIGAPNTAAALEWMNFVYEPEVQADIAEYVTYVTPVDGVQEILAERDPELGESDLIFPDEEFTADCTPQPNPPGDEEEQQEVTDAWQEVVSG